jgi:phospholipase C
MSDQGSTAEQAAGKPSGRAFIAGASAVGIGAAVSQVSAAQSRLIGKALAASTSSASFGHIEHIVILTVHRPLFRHPVALAGTLDVGIPYPLPGSNPMPSQATTPARPSVPQRQDTASTLH